MDWGRVLTLTFLVIGETFAERSGVFNLAIEGIMLFCGIVGFAGAYATGNLWMGVGAAALAGAVLGLIYAVFAVSLRADQIVAGFAMLIIASGSAIYLNRLAFPSLGGEQPMISPFAVVPVPFLSDLPIVGKILFNHTMLTYLMLACVVVGGVVLYRTRFGLRISAVGEYPQAADAVDTLVSSSGLRWPVWAAPISAWLTLASTWIPWSAAAGSLRWHWWCSASGTPTWCCWEVSFSAPWRQYSNACNSWGRRSPLSS
jgi:ABC-type uncharacterized transport system permease subunit